MTSIRYTKILSGKFAAVSPDRASVESRRVRDASGKLKVVRTIDMASASLDQDLVHVFTKNVEKARRENRLLTGRSDFAVAKD